MFDSIQVKEMWQVEAIQLLKRFNNDLQVFIDKTVTYNSRYEKVEFTGLHKQMLEMGQLNQRQLKEGIELLKQVSQRGSPGKFYKSRRRQGSLRKTSLGSMGPDLDRVNK